VATRFIGYGWNVTRVGDANDLAMLTRAFEVFGRERSRPTLIIVDSHIAYGAPTKEGTAKAHGEPLGPEKVRATKRFYGWPEDATFYVPAEVYGTFADGIGKRGEALREAWMSTFARYRREYSELADQLYRMQHRQLPDGWDADIPGLPADAKGLATRDSNGQVLSAFGQRIPWLVGGSADLTPSTKTRLAFDGSGDVGPGSFGGRNLHFGCGNSPPRPSPTACHCPRPGRTGRPSSSSPTSPAGPSGCPRSWRSPSSTSSPTTPSASAKTARPTSRPSSSPRCAPSRACSCSAPVTPTRSLRRGGPSCPCGTLPSPSR
jgi:hypothetical protein